MKYKLSFLFIFGSLFIQMVISHEVIPKYGEKKTYNYYIFLDVSGFNKDEKIYISITTEGYYWGSGYIHYNFYEKIDGISSFSISNSVYYSSSSSVTTFGKTEETYNYRIKKSNANANYLYLKFNDFHLPVTIENTEKDSTTTIIIIAVICSVVFLGIFIAIIVCLCRRCRNNATIATTVYPSASGYAISPYVMQPGIQPGIQPVVSVQPYGTNYPTPNPNYNPNIQYGNIPQNQPESEYRIDNNNNNLKYEKPM